jgi:transposase
MAKTLSQDLRGRLIAAVEGGMSRRAAAKRFEVGEATAIRWVREYRTTGATTAKPRGGDRRSHRIETFHDMIDGAIKTQVDITLVELADRSLDHGHAGHTSTMAMPRLGWRYSGHMPRPEISPTRILNSHVYPALHAGEAWACPAFFATMASHMRHGFHLPRMG